MNILSLDTIDTREMRETTATLEESPCLHSLWEQSHTILAQHTRPFFLHLAITPAAQIDLPNIVHIQRWSCSRSMSHCSTQRIRSSMMSVYAPALEDVLSALADFIYHLWDTSQRRSREERRIGMLLGRLPRSCPRGARRNHPRGCGHRVLYLSENGGVDNFINRVHLWICCGAWSTARGRSFFSVPPMVGTDNSYSERSI
jgi:hypothetical protein